MYAAEELTEEIATNICVDEFALRKGHNYATSVLNADTGRILAIVPHRDQDAITAVLQKVTGPIRAVVSDFALAIANAIQAVYPNAIHVLERFHLMQFFTDAQQRKRRYLGEAKKQHKLRFTDRCLARKPEQLTEEERGFVAQWHQEDVHIKYIYQALNHMRYVLKATMMTQAKRRLIEWFKQYQFHMCGAVSKIAKTLIARERRCWIPLFHRYRMALSKARIIKLNSSKDTVLAIEMKPFIPSFTFRNRSLILSPTTFGDEPKIYSISLMSLLLQQIIRGEKHEK